MTTRREPLWTPSAERVARARLTRFIEVAREASGRELPDYDALYAWSVDDLVGFWSTLWNFVDPVVSRPADQVLARSTMPGADWFGGARLNFAENLLRHRDSRVALIQVDETGQRVDITHAELYARVSQFSAYLRSVGVQEGDRVAAFLPNRSEAVIAMLAASSLGAIFSSCSPDFGLKGVLDRFGQIGPKVLVATDGYRYGGKVFSSVERVAEVVRSIPSLVSVVMVPVLGKDISTISHATMWSEACDNEARETTFAQLPFDHPLFILYSSGTTGVPKCIVHGAGGTLLQHAKELILHTDLRREDAIFYYTTTGWMMWNWLVSSLFVGATVVLYDGSPAHPDTGALFRLAEEVGLTHFGTSPKFLGSVEKSGLTPGQRFDLSRLRVVLSTGSPLAAEQFAWVYRAVKADLQLASISGGTDIVSCFMLGSPISPVYAGEIQKRGLGMRVEAWDTHGKPVVGEKGELVCTAPFVSMPVGFWNDPDGRAYTSAYFQHYPGTWRHGDFIEVTERGGVIVYGRSDATLNPGGVRIGTAEIYRVVEAMEEVTDSLVVGQPYQGDVRIVLFIVLREGVTLGEGLTREIKHQIRTQTTPRHVPSLIVQAPAVPRTISGKKVELGVLRVLQGQPLENRDALANPEAMTWYANCEVRT